MPAGAPNTPPNGPPPSAIQTHKPAVEFDPHAVPPQSTLYLQDNDYIFVNLKTNSTLTTVRFNYRYLTPQGEVKEGEFDTPQFSGSNFQIIPLGECWLLSFGARVTSSNAVGMWCYMQVQLFRTPTLGQSGFVHSCIWEGFVTSNASQGFPGSPIKDILDGPGQLISVTGTTPAAGADINEVVPSQRRWQLMAITATLTTSAAVATRSVTFLLDDGANIWFEGWNIVNQAASLALPYTASHQGGGATNFFGAIPIIFGFPTMLRSTWRIRTLTNNIQAGDQWSAPHYAVIEWGAWD